MFKLKKSQVFRAAIMAVIDDSKLCSVDKVSVLESLFSELSLAEWSEKQEEKRAQEEGNNG